MTKLLLALLLISTAQAQTLRKIPLRHGDLRRHVQDQYLLTVDLSGLNAGALAQVRAQTGFGPTQPVPGRHISLVDFLPPFMQATVGKNLLGVHHYEPVNRALMDEAFTFGDHEYNSKGELAMHSFANCWGTAWEAVRLLHPSTPNKLNFTAFWYGRYDAELYLEKNTFSDPVTGARRFGDVVLYKVKRAGMDELLHASVVVGTFAGQEVHFEKIDSLDGTPYRLALGEDIAAKYTDAARDMGGELVTSTRRFNGRGKLPLPEARRLAAPITTPTVDYRALFPRSGLAIARLFIAACGDKRMGGCEPFPVLLQDYRITQDRASGRHVLDPTWQNNARLVPAN